MGVAEREASGWHLGVFTDCIYKTHNPSRNGDSVSVELGDRMGGGRQAKGVPKKGWIDQSQRPQTNRP